MYTVASLVNQRFGRLVVLERAGSHPTRGATWKCECDCGSTTVVPTWWLKTGRTKSCGCYKKDTLRAANLTHGMTRHPLSWVFADMRRRCYVPKSRSYKDYGGRGITICDEWLSNRTKFFDWALANGWEKGLSIDRRDNDGNYEPSNCQIATRKQQANNRRSSVVVDVSGEKLSGLKLVEFVDSFGVVSYATFLKRVKRGVPPRIAASTPTQSGHKHLIGAT